MNTTVILISVLAFLAVVALVEGIYLIWQTSWVEGRSKIRRRLHGLAAARETDRGQLEILREHPYSADPVLNRILVRTPGVKAADRLLQQAGSDATVVQLFALQVLGTLLVALVLVLGAGTVGPLAVLAGALLGVGGPVLYLRQRRQRRQRRFVELLPDTMDFLARGLRSGSPFTASLQYAAREMPSPVSDELAIAFDEINYGLEVEQALRNLQARVGSKDVAYFVTAVLIQRRTGGNLAEVLVRIAAMLRERQRTLKEVQVQAAEMKLSAHVLIALPIFVAGFLSLFRWEYMAVLFEHPAGLTIVGAQLMMMGVGYLVMRRMVNFRI